MVNRESTSVSSQNSELARQVAAAGRRMVEQGAYDPENARHIVGHELRHRLGDDAGSPGRIVLERVKETYHLPLVDLWRTSYVGHYRPVGDERSTQTLRRIILGPGDDIGENDRVQLRELRK